MKSLTLANVQKFLLAAVVSTQVSAANAIPAGSAFEMDGGLLNSGAVAALINAFSVNAAPATLNPNYVALANASGQTLNAATVPTGIANTTIVRSGAAGVSDTTDLAWNIVNSIPGAFQGMTFPLTIMNLNSGTLTLVAGSGVTLAGTTSIATLCCRFYQGKITQVQSSSAYVCVGITGGTYSQSGNLVTLTLTGNTGGAPTVGQIIQLTPTSGAFGSLNTPSWWPIVSQSSQTSFVVFNPVSQTTSGNVNTFTVNPPVVPLTYSPLVTLQGMFASVTGFTV